MIQDCVIHCISEVHQDHWKILETCLIISEDVITYEIQSFFNSLKSNEGKEVQVSQSILEVLSCLRKSLPLTILNSQFELRRMGSQLLPTLARATLLFDVQNIFDEELINDKNGDGNLNNGLLTACVWCGWTAEITKAIQYILEYFVPEEKYTESLQKYSSSSFIGLGIWANKVRGRLNEEETRLSYNSGLQDVKNCGNFNSSLTAIMMQSMKRLSLLNKKVIACSQRLYSVDFCEASILSFVVISWNLHLISSEEDSLTVPYDCMKRAINQMLELECLSASLSVNSLSPELQHLINWLESMISPLDYEYSHQFVQLKQQSNMSPPSPTSTTKNRIEDTLLMPSITDPMVPLFENGAPPSPKNMAGTLPSVSNSIVCRRWLCEAISPILPTLAVIVTNNIEIVFLAIMVSLWIEV
jgi:hypothetical protein